jgi:flagellar hook-length control protein FliK
VPPPYRGATPVAQQPALPSIGMLDVRAAGLHLLAQTDGALARQTLLQIASLPDAVTPQQQTDAPPKLTMDIPLATPLGTAIVQLQIEHDEERNDGDARREKTWRINLAIDLEPLGPVRATVSQVGGLTHVALLAERRESAQALRDDLPMLEASLAEAALDIGDLQCRTGKPQASPAPAGLFVDRAS